MTPIARRRPAPSLVRAARTAALAALAVVVAAPQARAQDEGEGDAGRVEERALAPYFFVKGGDPAVDRLPLEATHADIHVAGVVAHVRVKQTFSNLATTPIEAVYVFPASTRAAVHGMRMRIGARLVEARIERKQKARADYERARSEGKRAALLEQHRSNVFRTSVANLMPGDRIDVELEYSEMLVPEAGVYELVYPGVVGPRYPGGADPHTDAWMKTAHLPRVGDPAAEAAPYRWDVAVHLETGVPVYDIASPSHAIALTSTGPTGADVKLRRPGGGDRDFVLRYRLSGSQIATGVLLYPGAGVGAIGAGGAGSSEAGRAGGAGGSEAGRAGGASGSEAGRATGAGGSEAGRAGAGGAGADGENFFALMMEPPQETTAADAPPREYIFVLDVSGSMHGFPLDTTKALMRRLFADMGANDRFNVVLFAGASETMVPAGSVAATPANLAAAFSVIDQQRGGGGTELLGGLQAAYAIPRDGDGRSRTIVLVTDGYVGVEAAAFRLVRESLGDANLFAFGIGSGVNRELIEGCARAGMGEPFVVLNQNVAGAEAERFRKMIERPLLTNIKVAYRGFEAYDVAPTALPDLMAARPLVLFGKYRGTAAPQGEIVVTGTTGHGPFRRVIQIDGRAASAENAALRWLWARKQAQWLDDEIALGDRGPRADVAKDKLAIIGLNHSLLTSQTSFVAVDRIIANRTGDLTRADQPLPLPAGVGNLAVASQVVVSREIMPPGDPILTVEAPREARRVTAYFPFGLTKELSFEPLAKVWQTRFLVPKDVPDGHYFVKVAIDHTDGRVEMKQVRYTIDSSEPDFDFELTAAAGGVGIEVTTASKARLVTVALVSDPTVRIDLLQIPGTDGTVFAGILNLPAGAHALRIVVADQARNEADHLVTWQEP